MLGLAEVHLQIILIISNLVITVRVTGLILGSRPVKRKKRRVVCEGKKQHYGLRIEVCCMCLMGLIEILFQM